MILKTRLFKPPINKSYITRVRLFDFFKSNWYKPFHLILAGAGYGKSVLMSQWLDQINEGYSWITLGKDCNDMRVFLSYFAESLPDGSLPDELKIEIKELAETVESVELNFVLSKVLEAITLLEKPHVFVLDDYHLVENPGIHLFINEVINGFPYQHKLVFLSRHEPSLSFHKSKAFDQLNRIDTDQLKLKPDEIKDLSSKIFETPVDDSTALSFHKATEGWIVPLRLILKAYSEGKLTNRINLKSDLSTLELTEFLLEEVLNFEAVDIKEALMLASHFETFNIEMIIEIFSSDNAFKLLDTSVLENQIRGFISRSLFVISLDKNKSWYRFHELVREFLNTRSKSLLPEERIRNALIVGGGYLENNNFLDEAIRLNLEHGRMAEAMDIVERHRTTFINSNRFDIIERWLNLFPEEVRNRHPGLLLMKIYLCELAIDYQGLVSFSNHLQEILQEWNFESGNEEEYWAEFYGISAMPDLFGGELKLALSKFDKALDLVSKSQTYVHGFSLCFKSIALLSLGRESEVQTMLDEDKKALELSQSVLRSQNHLARALVAFMTGNIEKLIEESQRIRKIADPNFGYSIITMANYYLAFSNYQKNKMIHIDSYLRESLQHKFTTRPGWIIHSLYVRCLAFAAEFKEEAVFECLEEMEAFDKMLINYDFSNVISVLKCELHLVNADFAAAMKAYKMADFDEKGVTHRFYCPRLTRIKILVLAGDSEQLKKAKVMVMELKNSPIQSLGKIIQLELKCLEVILYARQDRIERALDLLESLLSETAEESIIRLFTDKGDVMKGLLLKLDKHQSDPHLEMILRSFELREEFRRIRREQMEIEKAREKFQSLSSTEMLILNLIAEGMRNKEIATHLHYSLGTVKTYVYNIYKKIGAKNRTNAILLHGKYVSLNSPSRQSDKVNT